MSTHPSTDIDIPRTPAGPGVALRASDADRDRLVAQLQGHVGAGRLTLDEFSERAALAYRARTRAELTALARDLPSGPPHAPATAPPAARRRLPAWLVALPVLVLLLGTAVLMFGLAVLAPWCG